METTTDNLNQHTRGGEGGDTSQKEEEDLNYALLAATYAVFSAISLLFFVLETYFQVESIQGCV